MATYLRILDLLRRRFAAPRDDIAETDSSKPNDLERDDIRVCLVFAADRERRLIVA